MRLIAPHLLPVFVLLAGAGLLGCTSDATSTSTSSTSTGGSEPECSEWQTPQEMSARDYVNSIRAIDLDGDGRAELITAGVSSVGVLRNQGDGTFTPADIYPEDGFPANVAPMDINGDGYPDLVVANYYNSKASVLLNDGKGILTSGTPIVVSDEPQYSPSGLAATDLNGDGKIDLAFTIVSLADSMVSVLFNQGDGTFAAAVSYPAGLIAYELIAADLDGDGKPDLAATDYESDELRVLWNQGDGTFAEPVIYAIGEEPGSLAAEDLDGDGLLDLVAAGREADGVSVLLQQKGRVFAPAIEHHAGAGATGVALADLDRDGQLDLAVSRDTSEANDLAVLYGDGKGSFGPPVYFTLAHKAITVATSDLNADGSPDVVVSSIFGKVNVLLNCAE